MKKSGIFAVLLAATAVVAPATPAGAATCTVAPTQAVVSDEPHQVTFTVSGAKDWKLQSVSAGSISAGLQLKVTDEAPVRVFDREDFRNRDAGQHTVRVTRDGSRCNATFRVLRDSIIGVDAYQEGTGRLVYGRLYRVSLNPQDLVWGPVAQQKITIQYKALSTGKWVSAGTATTDAAGKFQLLKKKIGKRTWRAVYAGTSTTVKASETTVG
ncbi:hypothetical protein [Kineosporia sp. NBRC 101731]|uniref:hypothetical protein n=1 Tax=Kineosporia sp. NBRC 101731 TaxID=3032199 RepID=UPI0024A4C7DC|nr:hypothetical protein [Kineosporia sp. NBRC 101731]GLY33686.1 hypothetical protein Kisp02_70510 [Kineosporia sp. NBRC 101731]